MIIQASDKLKQLPPYVFVDLDKKKKAAIEKGVDIISFGVGDPDLPTPAHIVEAGQKALADPANHHYPFGPGLMLFREAIASWYTKRFNVTLDPNAEIHALLGSKEGIGHIALGFINPGDRVLVPEPGYPVYHTGAILAGGKPYFMPLEEKRLFLPDIDAIPESVIKKAKIIFINYPNNPTSAVASAEFYKKIIVFARTHHIMVVHDAAYSELYYESPPISFLSLPGAQEVGVEIHSLSKTYAMTGWRLGWICGNADIIKIVSSVKDNYDSGVFNAMQIAGSAALNGPQDCVHEMRAIYKERRDVLCQGLRENGWHITPPAATFYVWAKTPGNINARECAGRLLEEAGIVCTPGSGLGGSGEGYIRFSLTVDEQRIAQAVERIGKIRW